MTDNNITDPDDEPIKLEGDEPEPLSLVDEDEMAAAPGEGLKTFGPHAQQAKKVKEFKRPLNADGSGATRCRIFHSKIAVPSLEFMEEQINDWLDGADIEVKHVGHLIGTMEGKRPEPNLLVIVWY
ncbi:MAG: hypothetical protein J7M21_06475 [Planctomycetes bacterium]|nr:hypothetical protein [Planctomycetota bacterium]